MRMLAKLVLVSKAWNEYATPLLYENVVLRSSSKYGRYSQVSLLQRTLEARPDLAVVVRSFRIDVPPSSFNYEQLDITTSLYLLPNLRSIDLHPNLESIETALRRNRSSSRRPPALDASTLNPKPKLLSLTISLPAYQKLTPRQIHSIYPNGDAPASSFVLHEFFDTSSLTSLDLYSQNGSYLFDDILNGPLIPLERQDSVPRYRHWGPRRKSEGREHVGRDDLLWRSVASEVGTSTRV
ncbi:hypothetical protein BDY24DRAFT_441066 [Mrakia frigida]|uniref:uncharacterized protein n=1 Tax=Mrakia frigida TaxID=29902 RepID=UPI003FCC01BB